MFVSARNAVPGIIYPRIGDMLDISSRGEGIARYLRYSTL